MICVMDIARGSLRDEQCLYRRFAKKHYISHIESYSNPASRIDKTSHGCDAGLGSLARSGSERDEF